jgi:hypothetical protein
MKPTDHFLQRLLSAAAKAPSQPSAVPPFGLETRVLAQWRAAAPDDAVVSLIAFFRRAMLGASLVLLLSAAWSFTHQSTGPAGDEAALLDYEIRMSLNP